MDWREAKKRLLQDKGRKEAYEKIDLEYEIGKMITEARIFKNLTQQKLAKLVGTKQPSIARLEKGDSLPSLSFLQKIARALGTQLLPPRFEFLEERKRRETKNVIVFVHFTNPMLLLGSAWGSEKRTSNLKLINDNHSVLSEAGSYSYARS